MRLKMMAAFILVVVVAVISVVVFVRMDSANQVQVFMYRGGMTGTENLVTTLESYYALNGSWSGVEGYFQTGMDMMNGTGYGPGNGAGRGQGMGMMEQDLQLADMNGKVIASLGQDRLDGQLTKDETDKSIELTDGRGQTAGFLLVNNGSSIQQVDTRPLIQKLDTAALRAGLLAGGIGLVLALLLSAGLLIPIRQLTKAARRLAAGDREQKVPVKGRDELAELARSFNTMTDSLKHSEEERRSMTADIAHELRTPLAVQRAHLEALQDGIYPMDVEHIQVVLDQTVLLSRLVEDLRTLALSDAGELQLQLKELDPVEVAGQTVERFKSQVVGRGIELEMKALEGGEPCPTLLADADRVEQVLNNLLSNALRHTPDGGKIAVTLACQDQRVIFRVGDSGEGIPPEAMPYVFDRFYRADRARTRHDGGSGLGLAIARQLARAHGGDLTASNPAGGGAEFVLSLPVQRVDKVE
ncbi:MAG: sensor histidine kinase [Anaerolineaceae bacterium]